MRFNFIIGVFIILTSCNSTSTNKDKISTVPTKDSVWNELPEVTSLSNLKQTEFVITLENPISKYKNTIYAPAFLYAWDKIKTELKSPIQLDTNNSSDFKLLQVSKSHMNSLLDTEYSASAVNNNGKLFAKAYFNKTLPFETKLASLEDPIYFNQKMKVLAFGMKYFDRDVTKFSKILYYLDDDNFILQLTPKDKQHEIIFIKGIDNFNTLGDAIIQANSQIEVGKKESKDLKQSWKYKIDIEDIFSIPKIKFNIVANYKKLEGQQFITKDNQKYFIEEAYQRTGFILNENGAVVESEAGPKMDSDESGETKQHPKKMVLDKSFLIVIKRKEQKNPYFVMSINNTELMTKK